MCYSFFLLDRKLSVFRLINLDDERIALIGSI